MLPVVVLVGRPNVGKSTLFNRLTGTRDALVADLPGVTRDRQYGYGRLGPVPYVVVDTGGLVEQPSGIEAPMRVQTERAVEEADVLVFITDARNGLTSQDHFVARELRRSGKRVVLAVNKAEGFDPDNAASDFHALGFGEPMVIASAHGTGCRELMETVLADFPDSGADASADDGRIRIAVIGRPNVGKSTLVNRLIGEERVIASDMPGTTRDSIFVPFARDEREFTLIDTAGVRRRGKVEDAIERASVARTLQAIDTAHVVIFVVDAHDSIGEQDASVLGLALQRGRALLIAVNKWDGIPTEQRDEIRRLLELKLDFVPYAPVHFISARHGTGVGELVAATIKAYDAAMTEIPTPKLTKALERAMVQHQPPLVRGRRIKLRYAHQGGRNPPRIIIHGNQTVHVPESYTRFLANVFRREFDLFASPVAVEYRTDANPYARAKPARAKTKTTRGTARGRRKRD
ncbi:MAG: ribosome biogenesis GTPase Der [Steroidobacteraceae bacterium]|jgi:GTP-binding protein|nr:ribosome biogenesis GTPase Der [Gammaproteobacteria bacterium]